MAVYRTCRRQVAAGVHRSRARSDRTAWRQWSRFCGWLGVPTDLVNITDPIPILQLFAERVRSGVLAAGGGRVTKGTVEGYLRAVAQIYASVGAQDPRLDAVGKLDFRLKRQFAAYRKEDPPSWRVRPIPLQLLHHVYEHLHGGDARHAAVADLAYIAFFFLLRPGEYCDGGDESDSTPFRLRDVTFYIGNRRVSALTASAQQIRDATYVSLFFTTQKNGIKGEAIGHGKSGHPTACPVQRIGARVRYLQSRGARPDAPLSSIYFQGKWRSIKSTEITSALRASATSIGDTVGLRPKEISARSLRAGGAMALLLGKVDTDTIKLVGRWRSDAMLVYLHVSARPIMQQHASTMVHHGAYTLIPGPPTADQE